MPVSILELEPDAPVTLGLVMVANEPALDEVVGRVIPNDPDNDGGIVVGGDRGVVLAVTSVADIVGARLRRGCLRLVVDNVVDFEAVVDVLDGCSAIAAPDTTRFPEPLEIPVPTSAPVLSPAFSTFLPSCFNLALASRLSPPEDGGLILLLVVPLLVPVTLAVLLIPLPLVAVPMLLVATVRETIPGAAKAPFVVDGV